MINLEKVKEAVELQKQANYQIDMLGKADEAVVNEMLELCDNFNLEECDMFIELMTK